MTITKDTPIAILTVGQLQEVLGLSPERRSQQASDKPKEYVFGLDGICRLFNVSRQTAQRYKDTIIADAVIQQGRKIMVDAEKAMELFKNTKR